MAKATNGDAPRRIQIRQVRSVSGHPEKHRRTLRALGLRGHQKSVVQNDTPAIRGMINQVSHMVEVTDVEEQEHG